MVPPAPRRLPPSPALAASPKNHSPLHLRNSPHTVSNSNPRPVHYMPKHVPTLPKARPSPFASPSLQVSCFRPPAFLPAGTDALSLLSLPSSAGYLLYFRPMEHSRATPKGERALSSSSSPGTPKVLGDYAPGVVGHRLLSTHLPSPTVSSHKSASWVPEYINRPASGAAYIRPVRVQGRVRG